MKEEHDIQLLLSKLLHKLITIVLPNDKYFMFIYISTKHKGSLHSKLFVHPFLCLDRELNHNN